MIDLNRIILVFRTMSPRGCGRGRRGRGGPPIRCRGRGEAKESSPREGLVTRKDAAALLQVVPPQAAPPLAALMTGIDPTTSFMRESF